MRTSLASLFIALSLLTLGACKGSQTPATSAVAPQPASEIVFKLPPGWKSIPAKPGTQTWIKTTTNGGILSFAHPTEPRPELFDESPWTPIKICGNHPAGYASSHQQVKGQNVLIEVVDTKWNGVRNVGTYIHAADLPPEKKAEAAIHGMCPKK